MVNLQPIEVKNKNLTSVAEPHTEPQTPTTSAEHRPGVSKFLTLPKEVKDANQADDLCTQICAYLKAPSKREKLTVYVNSCKVSNSLLMKKNCLWVLEGKDSRLWLRVIKKMHDQSAVGHPSTEKTLHMLRRHYYWLEMCMEMEQYLYNCHMCKRAKSSRNTYNGFF